MHTKTNKVTFSSLPENISSVELYVENLCTQYDIDDSIFGNMLISITEAVNNAIFHGNKKDPKKLVSLIHTIESDFRKTLIIKIIDEGDGFDFSNLPDPTDPENIEMIGGRGIFLIKQLADLVIFSDKGETIELHFKL